MSLLSNQLTPWERKEEYYSNIKLGRDIDSIKKDLIESTKDAATNYKNSSILSISSLDRISERVDNISYGIDKISNGINGLQAAFQWGIADVVWQIEQSNALLQNIIKILQSPLDTQAKELRIRAEEAYSNGWFEESLEDFLESEKKNRYDFSIHISIGTIYLFKNNDLDNALKYFEKAIKYARPKSNYYTSYALLHLALIKKLLGDIEEAEKFSYEAVLLSPEMSEAFYQCAQYNALLDRPEKSTKLLLSAIEMDINYCEKILSSSDFSKINKHIHEMFSSLRDREGEKVKINFATINDRLVSLKNELKKAAGYIKDDIDLTDIDNISNRIINLIRRNSFRDFIEASKCISELSNLVAVTKENIKSSLKNSKKEYYSEISKLNSGRGGDQFSEITQTIFLLAFLQCLSLAERDALIPMQFIAVQTILIILFYFLKG